MSEPIAILTIGFAEPSRIGIIVRSVVHRQAIPLKRCAMRAAPYVALTTASLLLCLVAPSNSPAYRDYFTAEQKAQLEKIQTVRVEALMLSDKGPIEAAPI